MNIRYSAPISIGMLARRPCSARRRFRPLARALRSSGTSLQARAFSFQSMCLCTCLKRKLSFFISSQIRRCTSAHISSWSCSAGSSSRCAPIGCACRWILQARRWDRKSGSSRRTTSPGSRAAVATSPRPFQVRATETAVELGWLRH